MKIGLVIYGSLETRSGGYLYDRKLVAGLRSQGEEVEVVSLPWRNYAAHLIDNLRWRLPGEFDILIQDELNHPSLITANKQVHPYPVISLVHHLRISEQNPPWLKPFHAWVEKRYLRSVDGFIFNSQTTQAAVEALAGTGKPHVIGYPPTDRFGSGLPQEAISNRAAAPGVLRVVFLGNVIRRKGLHVLIEAVRLCRMPVQLEVIGSLDFESAYARGMQQLAAEQLGKAMIRFHDAVWDEDLVRLLQRAQVLAVPSDYEGFGIVYLEGMAFGLPAIGTTSGAASETIEDGKTGFLVDPGNARQLARKLELLAEDRSLLAKMSENAKNRYLRQPSWSETVVNLHRFLRSRVDEFREGG